MADYLPFLVLLRNGFPIRTLKRMVIRIVVLLTYLSIIILSIIKEWFPHQDFEENGSMENVHSNKKYAFEKNMKKKICIEKIKNMKNKICIRNKKMH